MVICRFRPTKHDPPPAEGAPSWAIGKGVSRWERRSRWSGRLVYSGRGLYFTKRF